MFLRNHASHAEALLTLSFDVVDVFTLITGSPLDLSITTVLSVPLLPIHIKDRAERGVRNNSAA